MPGLRDASYTEGDIVVTPVVRHYAIGRVTADGETQAFIESQPDYKAALTRACALAGSAHAVWFAHSAKPTVVQVDCTSNGRAARWLRMVRRMRPSQHRG